MAGRLQKVAAVLVAVSAFGKPVFAASLFGMSGEGWKLTAHVEASPDVTHFVTQLALPYGQAGTTVRPGRGWNASLFVTSFDSRPSTDEDPLRARSASFVSGRITHTFNQTTRVSLDLLNLFDKRIGPVDYFSATRLWSYPGASDNFLFHPGESRGVRLRLRMTF